MNSLKNKILRRYNVAKRGLANFGFSLRSKMFGIKDDRKYKEAYYDKKLVQSLSKSKIPSIKQFKYLSTLLSRRETRIIKYCLFVVVVSMGIWGYYFTRDHLQIAPTRGGSYTEGLIGSPVHINPLYAVSNDVDSDIGELIFSSLFKRDKNGELAADLAEDYRVSDDNKVYTLTVRDDAKWHDGSDLTVNDIVYTFNIIKDPRYKSPLRTGFNGVEIQKIDDRTIKFTLAESYAAFFDLLTFGILPSDVWYRVPPESATLTELNLKPVGSGPYKFKSLSRTKTGYVVDYKLEINDDYYGEKPMIEDLIFKFFVSSQEAVQDFNSNNIEGISYAPRYVQDDIIAKESLNFHHLNTPQLSAVFFNQDKNSVLEDKKVRQALAKAIDKGEIINDVFKGEARIVDSPILPENFAYNKDVAKYHFNIEEARNMIIEAGWQAFEIADMGTSTPETGEDGEDVEPAPRSILGPGVWWQKKDGDNTEYLTITLTTVDNEENIRVAELIRANWELIGVKTGLNIVPASQIQVDVIKPRNFEALIYGQVLGYDPDSYAFWHSSQISDGLNISGYSNKDVDVLLEDARLATSTDVRIEKYKEFQKIVTEDIPAIFLYSPIYVYAQGNKVKGFDVKNILLPRDRFSNINEWYIKTGKKLIFK